MKTAMQELIEELRSLAFTECHISMGAIMLTQGHIDELEEKYLKKEKDQIISSYNEPLWITDKPNVKAEDYYKQTYKPETI